jgi:hypothetical protein
MSTTSLAVMEPAAIAIETAEHQVYTFPTEEKAREFEALCAQQGGACVRLGAAAPPVPKAARTLYDLETHLAALLDTDEMIPAELEGEYELELQSTLTAVVEKRDRVGQFRQHLVSQVELAKAERKRLEDRGAFYERALLKLDGYLTRIIDTLGLDPKGKRKKLEGRTLTLALHGCKKRVEITDEAAVPVQYKRVTVTLPAATWEALIDSLDFDIRDQILDAVTSPQMELNRTLAYTDLAADAVIPGLALGGGSYVEVK